MTPEEALDLLPLLVSNDLDESVRDEVRAALDGHPGVADELARWEELEGRLERGLAPIEVRVPALRCPYCRDGIPEEERALCGACLTPYHRLCFAENEGCSLLGCQGTHAVAPGARETIACGSCQGEAPRGAPFCPWCRARISAPAAPRHARRSLRASALLSYAASLLLLLPGGLGLGYLSERELERTWWQERGSLDALEEDAQARRVMRAVLEAQRLYRARRANGGDYSPDLAGVLPALATNPDWRGLHERFAVATEASLSRPDERFFATVSRPGRTYFANQEGRIVPLQVPLTVDRVSCRLVPGETALDPREDLVKTLHRAIDDLKDRDADRKRLEERLEKLEGEVSRKVVKR